MGVVAVAVSGHGPWLGCNLAPLRCVAYLGFVDDVMLARMQQRRRAVTPRRCGLSLPLL